MRLIQFIDQQQIKRVGVVVDDQTIAAMAGERTVYELAGQAISRGQSLSQLIGDTGATERIAYEEIVAAGRLLPPLTHPDPAHMLVTGTGLTHLGSADARDRMHQAPAKQETLTDSLKMFRLGLEGGKPAAGQVGVQPEWFYKGDGGWVVGPGQPLPSPAFALDHGEEPEIVGLYLIGPGGQPFRVGYALGNEFSDHVTERQNYLYLAHSKLRPSSFGPELLLGELPAEVRGQSRLIRDGQVIWEKAFVSGEQNMSHSLANLEHHHFKYHSFRRPGDVHVHFFGTATLSFADGVRVQPGDLFEIEAAGFGRPLRNPVAVAPEVGGGVKAL
jgi:hypothetical protein